MADTRYQKIDENSSPLLPSYKHDESFADIPRRRSRFNWTLAAKVSTIANLCFSAIILTLYLHAWAKWRKSPFYNAPDPPYSPLLEDGAITYVTKKFHPERIFQMEPSEDVDRAWNSVLGPSDGIVRLPKETADKLYKSSEIYYEPGYYIYGVSMFHQLHCLDTIRRSFYREHYFPNTTIGDYMVHRNHCLDYLRQAIMCNGDSAMTYWWNKNYTYIDASGQERFTDEYLAMTPVDRAYNTELLWDVKHQCRDFSKIQAWTEKHQLRNDAYWREYPHFRKPNFVADPLAEYKKEQEKDQHA